MKIKPLSDIRVLEVSGTLPHPYCTMLLADLGADVIKIQRRQPQVNGAIPNVSPRSYVNVLDRNKRSVDLDLKSEVGRRAFLALAESADVVVDGMRPGKMDAMGLGYETLKQTNKRLVYCSISGYGSTGPYKDIVGHDMNYLGVGGVIGINGYDHGPPMILSIPVMDMGSATAGAFAIMAALFGRDQVREAQYLDVSMTDLSFSWMALYLPQFFGGDGPPLRGRLRLWEGPWLHIYECKDGKYVTMANLEVHFWVNFANAVGRPDWADLPYFAKGTPEMHVREREILREVTGLMLSRTRDEWFEFLKDKDVAIAPVLYPLEEVLEDPHIKARGLVVDFDHERLGRVKQSRHPIEYSHFDTGITSRWPEPGEHTGEVLAELDESVRPIERPS